MSEFAWVTLATNDSYSLGALVLAHSLKQVGTKHQLVVLVTPGVTNAMREKLTAVFNLVEEVNPLDSKDEANLRLLKRPELGITFTKLHCWRLVQFQKCVFLDADTLVLSNSDELFDREEFSAAPDVGWPDCFNSGVFVYKPSIETYSKLVDFALQKGSFDGGDQGLLNLYFSDWAHKDIAKHLPFIYNMCSTAVYSYLPAFKQYGKNAKIVHFIGPAKPWLQYFNTENLTVYPSPGLQHLEEVLQKWWNIFCSLIHPNLSRDMSGLAGAFAQFTLGAKRTEGQDALENHLRRQAWEIGNIDYLGRDSFDHIWSKICESMAAPIQEFVPQSSGDNKADTKAPEIIGDIPTAVTTQEISCTAGSIQVTEEKSVQPGTEPPKSDVTLPTAEEPPILIPQEKPIDAKIAPELIVPDGEAPKVADVPVTKAILVETSIQDTSPSEAPKTDVAPKIDGAPIETPKVEDVPPEITKTEEIASTPEGLPKTEAPTLETILTAISAPIGTEAIPTETPTSEGITTVKAGQLVSTIITPPTPTDANKIDTPVTEEAQQAIPLPDIPKTVAPAGEVPTIESPLVAESIVKTETKPLIPEQQKEIPIGAPPAEVEMKTVQVEGDVQIPPPVGTEEPSKQEEHKKEEKSVPTKVEESVSKKVEEFVPKKEETVPKKEEQCSSKTEVIQPEPIPFEVQQKEQSTVPQEEMKKEAVVEPMLGQVEPKIEPEVVKAEADIPKKEVEIAKVETDIAKAQGEMLKVEGEVPKGEVEIPQEVETPKTAVEIPKAQAEIPKAEAEMPKAEAEMPKAEDTKIPKREVEIPKGEATKVEEASKSTDAVEQKPEVAKTEGTEGVQDKPKKKVVKKVKKVPKTEAGGAKTESSVAEDQPEVASGETSTPTPPPRKITTVKKVKAKKP